jgi:SAM-dependent methyltransferase
MNAADAKIGQPSEPGEYDDGMQSMLQIIWGDGFLSPGGAAEVARLLEGSDISGCAVLDIGCGLGAIDELLVKEYHAASVIGIDVDPSLLARMQERIERARMSAHWCRFPTSRPSLPRFCGSCIQKADSLPAIGCAEARRSIRRR